MTPTTTRPNALGLRGPNDSLNHRISLWGAGRNQRQVMVVFPRTFSRWGPKREKPRGEALPRIKVT